jgi:hypothetical protein
MKTCCKTQKDRLRLNVRSSKPWLCTHLIKRVLFFFTGYPIVDNSDIVILLFYSIMDSLNFDSVFRKVGASGCFTFAFCYWSGTTWVVFATSWSRCLDIIDLFVDNLGYLHGSWEFSILTWVTLSALTGTQDRPCNLGSAVLCRRTSPQRQC